MYMYIYIHIWLVVLKKNMFHFIYGMSSFPLTHIFQDGYCTTNQIYTSITKFNRDGHFGSIFFLGLTIHLTFSTGRHSSDENASLLSVAPVVQDIFGNQWDIGMLIFGNSILGICEYSDIGIWDI